MDNHQINTQKQKIHKKDNPLLLSVLNLPTKGILLAIPSPITDYKLFHHKKRKINIAVLTIDIPKAKLFANLEIYQWRKQTDFPIVKTRYVSVKNQTLNDSQKIQIQVFNQYCPLKLNHIYQMSISQALYLLKECLIGFERLFNRFGGFQISQNMISINQKGYCRVWINQNYALNNYNKRQCYQIRMVNKIIQIIQEHCIELKCSKRLFTALRKCSNFIQALKMVDTFIISQKILVPNRFSFLNFSGKDSKKQFINDSSYPTKSQQIFAANKIFNNSILLISLQHQNDTKKPIIGTKQKQIDQINMSPQQRKIKRFKSQDKMHKIYDMKVSAGQTSSSTQYIQKKGPSVQGAFNNCKQSFNCISNKIYKSQKRVNKKWMQQSSFLLNHSDQKINFKEKQRSQLTQSYALIQNYQQKDRRYSTKHFNSYVNPYYKFPNSIKKSQNDYLGTTTEISHIINDEENSLSSTPRPIIEEEEESKKIEHSVNIINNNGWKNNFTDLLDSSQALKNSIHAGEQQSIIGKQVQLQKLGELKKKTTMSILAQQFSEEL